MYYNHSVDVAIRRCFEAIDAFIWKATQRVEMVFSDYGHKYKYVCITTNQPTNKSNADRYRCVL